MPLKCSQVEKLLNTNNTVSNAPMGVIFGVDESTSCTLNIIPIGAACRPCGAKKTSNPPLTELNTAACALRDVGGNNFKLATCRKTFVSR